MPRFRRYKFREWAHDSFRTWSKDKPPVVAWDTETEGFGWHDPAFCVTATWRRPSGELFSAYFETDVESLTEEERTRNLEDLYIMLRGTPTWVFHNAKFDLQKLDLLGVLANSLEEIDSVHDTQTLFYLMDENSPKGLKPLAKRLLGLETDEEDRLKVVRRKLKLKREDGYHLLPREVIAPYAMKDTEFTLLLFEHLWPRFQKLCEDDPRVMEVYYEELEVSEVLRRMEANGIRVNVEYLTRLAAEYSIKVMEGWGRIVDLTGVDDPKFPNSPKQLKEAFEKRGHKLADTQEATLSKLNDDLANALLQYRSDAKIHKTYLRGLLNEQVDGLVHPNFNPTESRTGRMTSGKATG